MSRFPRRMLTNTYTAPTNTTAVGVYSLAEQLQAQKGSAWPPWAVVSFRSSSAWNTSGYTGSSTPVPVTMPAGTNAGDLVVIFVGFSGFVSTYPSTNKSGWTSTAYLNNPDYGYYGSILNKVVVADDLTGMTISPPDNPGNAYGLFLAMSFSGCSSISVQTNATVGSGSETSFNLPGITKTASAKFIVSVPVDRTGAANWTAGSGWTQTAQVKDVTGGVFNITGSYKDAGDYVNTATIPWTRSSTQYSAGSWTVEIKG